jgi:ATP-dependent Clp protease ATP-binding subunit ClpA
VDVYRFSGAAQRALAAAEKEALALGHLRLGSAHVVLGLLAERGAAAVALERLGVTAAAARKRADELYEGERGTRARDLDVGADEMREVFELARDEAEAAGEHDIAPLRLFLAATQDDAWGAYRLLEALKVDVERARRETEALGRDERQGSLPS